MIPMLYSKVTDIILDDIFLDLSSLVDGIRLILKLENFNFGGSIKAAPAIGLLNDGEGRGLLVPGGHVIESSSGNLGIALSAICAVRAEVRERDENGGFLQTRIDFIVEQFAADPRLFWPNQYANLANPRAHYERTAVAIAREVPRPACVFIGVGTTGTLMGCGRYFREHLRGTKIIAVDTEGSVTFGSAAGPRYIPGLGTSRRPDILRPEFADQVVLIPEAEAVQMCRRVAREHGIAVGGYHRRGHRARRGRPLSRHRLRRPVGHRAVRLRRAEPCRGHARIFPLAASERTIRHVRVPRGRRPGRQGPVRRRRAGLPGSVNAAFRPIG
jgi:N-(2-amino-2-carboxyethyl)-L-glutamate synthase